MDFSIKNTRETQFYSKYWCKLLKKLSIVACDESSCHKGGLLGLSWKPPIPCIDNESIL